MKIWMSIELGNDFGIKRLHRSTIDDGGGGGGGGASQCQRYHLVNC